MKVLWLCNIILPKISQKLSKSSENVGGWIVGLADSISKYDNIKLNICSPIYEESKIIKGNVDNIDYYCYPKKNFDATIYDFDAEKYLMEIVKEVNPDIIHIFGTEYPHTLAMINVCEKLGIKDKVIINIQGLVSVIEKHYYAGLPKNVINKYTIRDFLRNDNIKKQREKFKKRGIFEVEAIKKTSHVIGRTDWDLACTKQINPNVNYHFCNETLRGSFYENQWDINKCEKYSIFISQCSYPIKGFHFMLEAMPKILEQYPNAHIYTTGKSPLKVEGIKEKIKLSSYQKYIAKLIKKYNLENHITFLGSLNEKDMCERFLKSHVFVSPSSIENSPNSVGEAMILGVPTVSSDVGGVKNMMQHDIDGFIYQHDAIYMLSHYVCEIFNNDKLAINISNNSKKHARVTHNRDINLETLIKIYKGMV